jgi:hypothetical protein
MKLRFPFKDYALRWKDDATVTEKLVWGMLMAILGLITGNLLFKVSLTYLRGLEVKQLDVEDLLEL